MPDTPSLVPKPRLLIDGQFVEVEAGTVDAARARKACTPGVRGWAALPARLG